MNPVILGCGKDKRNHPCQARDLYVGHYFRSALSWATSVRPDSQIYVLSARHGLLRLNTVVAPYNTTFGDAGTIAATALAAQATLLGLTGRALVLVAGKPYLRLLSQAQPPLGSVTRPFARFGGVGWQRGALRKYRGTMPPHTESTTR